MSHPSSVKQPVVDEEDDLDDLNDVLTEFTAEAPIPPKPTAPVPPAPSAVDASLEFPDPEDDDLALPDSSALGAELEAGMAQLMAGLGGDDQLDFQRIMAEIMGTEMGGGTGMGGLGDDGDAEAFFAKLARESGTTAAGGAQGSSAPAAGGSGDKGKAPADFQSTIGSSLSALRTSSETASAKTASSAAAGSDPMMAMMAQMAGLGGAGGMGEEGMADMLSEMMEQLMSRDLLYVPLKELSEKYPAFLKSKGPSLDPVDMARFLKQQKIVAQIVAKFEEPGADSEATFAPGSPEDVAKKQRGQEVVELVGQMNDCGAPPTEIMGEMPEGMELGADGVPKMPGDCPIS